MKFANYKNATAAEKALILMVGMGEAVPAEVIIPKKDGGVTTKIIFHVGHKTDDGQKKCRPHLLREMTISELLEVRDISRNSLDALIRSGRATEEALARKKRIEQKLEDIENTLAWKRAATPKPKTTEE